MPKFFWIGFLVFLLAGCGGNPYLESSLDAAELEGKNKSWFVKHWGQPQGRSPRFFGGETWTYLRIAGGETGPPFYNFTPNECRIKLKFNDDGTLDGYSYSDC